ncbi:unnamed protein product [Urochloa humidicola]
MIAAASDSLWNGGTACGLRRMYTVSCAGGTNTPHREPLQGRQRHCQDRRPVPVAGVPGHARPLPEAFNTIGNLDVGKILINYNQ